MLPLSANALCRGEGAGGWGDPERGDFADHRDLFCRKDRYQGPMKGNEQYNAIAERTIRIVLLFWGSSDDCIATAAIASINANPDPTWISGPNALSTKDAGKNPKMRANSAPSNKALPRSLTGPFLPRKTQRANAMPSTTQRTTTFTLPTIPQERLCAKLLLHIKRTTIDIPEDLYSAIKIHVAERGMTFRDFMLRAAQRELECLKVEASDSWKGIFGIMAAHPEEMRRIERRINDEFDSPRSHTPVNDSKRGTI